MPSATDLSICFDSKSKLVATEQLDPVGVYSTMHSSLKCSQRDSPDSVRLIPFFVLIVVRRESCHKFLEMFQ